MLKVEELIKHLSISPQESDPLILSFFNYLNNFCRNGESFSTNHLKDYFRICLDFAHWQQNKHLFQTTLAPLLNEIMDLEDIRWPHQLQTIEVESIRDLMEVAEKYLNRHLAKETQYRLINDQDKRILAIILHPNQNIQVRIFDRKMVLAHGEIEPLKLSHHLLYHSNLDILEGTSQRFEIGPFIYAHFQLKNQIMEGSVSRGYLLQKIHDLNGMQMSHFPKLFFSIKKIEQFFVQRQSDPFYIEVTDRLEQAIESARITQYFHAQDYLDILAYSSNLLEYVFTGDKLLSLLIRDLQHTISLRDRSVEKTPQKEEDLWNLQIPPYSNQTR